MTTYYNTDRIPQFTLCRFLASGNTNWDYFLSPTCPWVYYVAKAPSYLSGGWGTLNEFLDQQTQRHKLVDYLLPIPEHYRRCQNTPVDTALPPYKRPMPCCPQQRIRAYGC